MTTYIMIAIGGALGAMGRFAATKWISHFTYQGVFGIAFPWATFAINLIGSLLIGLVFVLMTERITALAVYRPLIMVGFLGAFTTFSTFSLEILQLLQQQSWLTALSYLLLSCFLGVVGAAIGMFIGRLF